MVGHAEARRTGARLRGRRPDTLHALLAPRAGRRLLLPQGLHARLHRRGRRSSATVHERCRGGGQRGGRVRATARRRATRFRALAGAALPAGGRSARAASLRAYDVRWPLIGLGAARDLRDRAATARIQVALPQRAGRGGPRRRGPAPAVTAAAGADARPAVAPAISVVIPMFNEEAYVRRAVAAARDVLDADAAPTGRSCSWTTPPPTRTGALADALAARRPARARACTTR